MTDGTGTTGYTYDGFSRRSRITEKNAATAVTSDKRYLWAEDNQPAEERDATGGNVLIQYHPQGERRLTTNLFHTKDHLGSVREILDSSGTLQTRYDYDMWGKRIKSSGTLDSDVSYTGHHHHAKSGLILTWFRAYDYDANSGTWLSRDPLREAGGLNLYGYVEGNPTDHTDPLEICRDSNGLSRCLGDVLINLGLNFTPILGGLKGALGIKFNPLDGDSQMDGPGSGAAADGLGYAAKCEFKSSGGQDQLDKLNDLQKRRVRLGSKISSSTDLLRALKFISRVLPGIGDAMDLWEAGKDSAACADKYN